jgi:hypothetical protein
VLVGVVPRLGCGVAVALDEVVLGDHLEGVGRVVEGRVRAHEARVEDADDDALAREALAVHADQVDLLELLLGEAVEARRDAPGRDGGAGRGLSPRPSGDGLRALDERQGDDPLELRRGGPHADGVDPAALHAQAGAGLLDGGDVRRRHRQIAGVEQARVGAAGLAAGDGPGVVRRGRGVERFRGGGGTRVALVGEEDPHGRVVARGGRGGGVGDQGRGEEGGEVHGVLLRRAARW